MTRGPYLQLGGERTMTIVWNTDVPSDGEVRFGRNASLGEREVDSVQDSLVHVVTLTGLRRDARYHYQIRSGGRILADDLTFRTFPEPECDRSFRLLAWGDSGTGDEAQMAMVERIEDMDADIAVHTGDLIYPDGEAENFDPRYFQPYEDLISEINVYPSLGNHDYRTESGQPYLDAFFLPDNNPAGTERYYSFDYAGVHIAAVDTNQDFTRGSAQYRWLDNDLDDAPGDWKVVFHHHTPYTTGATHAGDLINADLREHLGSLYDRHDVDIVLVGHTHAYERTLPIRNARVATRDDGPNYVDPPGSIYITTGGGGRRLNPQIDDHPNLDFSAVFASAFHATRLDFDGLRVVVRAIGVDGDTIDRFSITKTESDCNGNREHDDCDLASGRSEDCNENGVPDECESDCDEDGVPDECEPDCDDDGVPDGCELREDCNDNGVPDECEADCDDNGVPDECEPDCDGDGRPDACELASRSEDCNDNGIPDECEEGCSGDGFPDECQPDCDEDGVPDDCEADCDEDGVPDDCEADCDEDGVPDECALVSGVSSDCNEDGIPDACEEDCDGDGLPDDCEPDCNESGTPDDCDLALGLSSDADQDGVPDDCQVDCDGNSVPDELDVVVEGRDTNGNGKLDTCETPVALALGAAPDPILTEDGTGAVGFALRLQIPAGAEDVVVRSARFENLAPGRLAQLVERAELRRDTNGNGVFDEGDAMLGTASGGPLEEERVEFTGLDASFARNTQGGVFVVLRLRPEETASLEGWPVVFRGLAFLTLALGLVLVVHSFRAVRFRAGLPRGVLRLAGAWILAAGILGPGCGGGGGGGGSSREVEEEPAPAPAAARDLQLRLNSVEVRTADSNTLLFDDGLPLEGPRFDVP